MFLLKSTRFCSVTFFYRKVGSRESRSKNRLCLTRTLTHTEANLFMDLILHLRQVFSRSARQRHVSCIRNARKISSLEEKYLYRLERVNPASFAINAKLISSKLCFLYSRAVAPTISEILCCFCFSLLALCHFIILLSSCLLFAVSNDTDYNFRTFYLIAENISLSYVLSVFFIINPSVSNTPDVA